MIHLNTVSITKKNKGGSVFCAQNISKPFLTGTENKRRVHYFEVIILYTPSLIAKENRGRGGWHILHNDLHVISYMVNILQPNIELG